MVFSQGLHHGLGHLYALVVVGELHKPGLEVLGRGAVHLVVVDLGAFIQRAVVRAALAVESVLSEHRLPVDQSPGRVDAFAAEFDVLFPKVAPVHALVHAVVARGKGVVAVSVIQRGVLGRQASAARGLDDLLVHFGDLDAVFGEALHLAELAQAHGGGHLGHAVVPAEIVVALVVRVLQFVLAELADTAVAGL